MRYACPLNSVSFYISNCRDREWGTALVERSGYIAWKERKVRRVSGTDGQPCTFDWLPASRYLIRSFGSTGLDSRGCCKRGSVFRSGIICGIRYTYIRMLAENWRRGGVVSKPRFGGVGGRVGRPMVISKVGKREDSESIVEESDGKLLPVESERLEN